MFFQKESLPSDPVVRDRVLLEIIGEPDQRRLNGLGGVTINTSKIVLVSRSTREGVDVDYIHGQVALDQPVIDYNSNGGNMSFAVALFAVNRGWVHRENGQVSVTIYAENTQDQLVARFSDDSTHDAESDPSQNTLGTADIALEFQELGRGLTGPIFPTGSPVDTIELNGSAYRVTIIDAGNLTVQVHAAEFGLTGTETEEEQLREAFPLIQELHRSVREMLHVTGPGLPKIMIVESPKRYTDRNGLNVEPDQITLCARDVSWGRYLHSAFPVTGAAAFAVSCRIPGTLAHTYANRIGSGAAMNIGHPSGILEVNADVATTDVRGNNGVSVRKVIVGGSASALMDGTAWVSEKTFEAR